MTVLEAVIQHHDKTDGKCGLSLPSLMEIMDTELEPLKIELNKLWKEDKITIREGINGKLIFKSRSNERNRLE